MKKALLETPELVIDLDKLDNNIQRVADIAEKSGVKLRPHVKTHKIPAIAHKKLDAGVQGMTVTKLGEGEDKHRHCQYQEDLPHNSLQIFRHEQFCVQHTAELGIRNTNKASETGQEGSQLIFMYSKFLIYCLILPVLVKTGKEGDC
jgi:hypothetical protein